MECQFGITGKGYTIIASDSNAARSIIKMKGDEDKMKELSKHLVMAYNGEAVHGEEPEALWHPVSSVGLTLEQSRGSSQLPLQKPRRASTKGSRQLDSIAARIVAALPKAIPGQSAPRRLRRALLVACPLLARLPRDTRRGAFCCSRLWRALHSQHMDRFHRPDMSLEEGIDLLRMCIGELKKRFIVDLGQWTVRIVDRDGIRLVEL
ncbi:hypothetical protein L7F22_061275 [Adiantum nelumboides]|nr:hypothetical protein [Adiantum nelumboides]